MNCYPEAIVNPQTRDQYIVRSLIQEAITSSQIEGAAMNIGASPFGNPYFLTKHEQERAFRLSPTHA